jgi:hypothetical protein
MAAVAAGWRLARVALALQDGRPMAHRFTLPLAALVLAPAVALAQSQTLTIAESSNQDNAINLAECSGARNDNLTLTWTTSGFTTGTTTGTYEVVASDTAGCLDSDPNTKSIDTIPATAANGSYPPSGKTINVAAQLVAMGIKCDSTAPANLIFCARYRAAGGTTAVTSTAEGSIQLDVIAPAAPNATRADPSDSGLIVNWGSGSGSVDAGVGGSPTSFKVYCSPGTAGTPATGSIANECGTVTGAGTTQARVGGLQNGTTYDVQVTALTIGGNESGRSNTIQGTPVQVDDFWRGYRGAGGREQGGCGTGAAGLVALLAAAPLALRRFRRKS